MTRQASPQVFDLMVGASKNDNKSYIFLVKTDSDGDIMFRAKRNLEGVQIGPAHRILN